MSRRTGVEHKRWLCAFAGLVIVSLLFIPRNAFAESTNVATSDVETSNIIDVVVNEDESIVFKEDLAATGSSEEAVATTGNETKLALQGQLAGDSPATAKAIAPGQQVVDVCSTYKTSCWYTFTISNNGYVSTTFESDWVAETYNGWYIRLYAPSDLQNNMSSDFFSGGGVVPRTFGRYGLAKGTYYVEVEPSGTAETQFRFTLNYGASSVWERERNGSASIANEISLGVRYFGNLHAREASWLNPYDADCYKFKLNSPACIRLAFGSERDYEPSMANFESDSGEFICMLHKASQVGTDDALLYQRCYGGSSKDIGGTVKLSAGTYYVLVKGGGYTSTANYHLSVSSVKLTNPIKLKAVKRATKASKTRKKAVTLLRPFRVSSAQGALTFKRVSGSKRLSVNKKTGKVRVKKGTKRGMYRIKIKVTASGNAQYKKRSKTITCSVVVK